MEKITLTAESETLFIPLYSKAQMSRGGKIISDKKAEEIVSRIDYDFSKIKKSKYLDIYMGIRAAIIDDYTNQFIKENPGAVILHLGCGLDSRIDRIEKKPRLWYDLDFPDVIKVRKQFYSESENYRMISSSFSVKASQYKNPVNKMGATIRWGLDSPEKYADEITHLEAKYFTNYKGIEQLSGFTKFMFKLLYANNLVKDFYRIYIFKIS